MTFGISRAALEQKLAVVYNRAIRKVLLIETKRQEDERKKAQTKEAAIEAVVEVSPQAHIQTLIKEEV